MLLLLFVFLLILFLLGTDIKMSSLVNREYKEKSSRNSFRSDEERLQHWRVIAKKGILATKVGDIRQSSVLGASIGQEPKNAKLCLKKRPISQGGM